MGPLLDACTYLPDRSKTQREIPPRTARNAEPRKKLPGQHAELLTSYGATASEIEELLAYNRNVFDRSFDQVPILPLPAEPHVAEWERYALEAARVGALGALRHRLVQLWSPIREGISMTDVYRAATLRGTSTFKG